MKQTLPDNIPEQKKQELKKLVKIIREYMRPEFIILFGSYARGDFVEYDETIEHDRKRSYASDFDILVIVSNEKVDKDFKIWKKIEDKLGKQIETSIDLMRNHIQFVNEKLSDGVPLFYDIKKDGIVLFSNNKSKLVAARKLNAAERKKKAEDDFDYYTKEGKNNLKVYNFCIEENLLNKAAFELHQTTENLFIAIQMVFTSYAPKEHNLEKLEKIVVHFDYDPHEIFPRDTPEEKHLFELLKKSYVDSRYNPNFKITKNELEILFERVKKIEQMIEKLCEDKIGEM